MTEPKAPPAQPSAEQPVQGGSYVRQANGKLKRVEHTTEAEPAAEQEA